MPLKIMTEFLNDLKEVGDPKFVRHVLNHTIAEDGTLKPDKDDHRYDGIADGWIRYVTGGKTAYRVIYLRKGDDVYLYRAGRHSVEDRLAQPTELELALNVTALRPDPAPVGGPSPGAVLLKTTEGKRLSKYLLSMYHFKHKEIYIVAPFIDLALLDKRHHFGRFLDRAVEDDTLVAVVTTPQDSSGLPAFQDLERRGINVFFLNGLHAKLYIFEIDSANGSRWQQGTPCAIVVGSSNFTFPGTGLDDRPANEELCCSLPQPMLEDVKNYAVRLTNRADDYVKYAHKLARSKT